MLSKDRNKKRGMVIVVSGPSGVGKTTICRQILKKDRKIKYSVSATTRPPRKGERNRHDYIFISRKQFENWIKKGKFLEYARVHQNLYGTPKEFIFSNLRRGFDVMLDIDVQGARTLRKRFSNGVFIFVAPPSIEELSNRLRKRGADSPLTIQQRLNVARRELKERKKYNYIIFNDNINEAVDLFMSIIKFERYKRRRIWN